MHDTRLIRRISIGTSLITYLSTSQDGDFDFYHLEYYRSWH